MSFYGVNPQSIGKTMPHGFAGMYSRQPDEIVNTFPAGGSTAIVFGTPLKYSGGKVVAMGSGDTGSAFIGVAGYEVKSSVEYLNQVGCYMPDDAVSVFMRGRINVKCSKGSPAYGTAVYVRVAENVSYPDAKVGDFEAESDSTNTVQLLNCIWAGAKDGNGIAELCIQSLMQPGASGSPYNLPVATASVLGGVKQGTNTTVAASGAISVNDATATVKGAVLQGEAVADAAGEAPTAAEFKALLDSLRAAGVIAAE